MAIKVTKRSGGTPFKVQSYQLSVISYRLLVIGYRLSVVGYRCWLSLLVIGY
jgi:hypothetical protein